MIDKCAVNGCSKIFIDLDLVCIHPHQLNFNDIIILYREDTTCQLVGSSGSSLPVLKGDSRHV